MSSRFQDAPEKVEWSDDHRAKIPGGSAHVTDADGNIYLAASLRNVGAGIAVLQGWYPYAERLNAREPYPDRTRSDHKRATCTSRPATSATGRARSATPRTPRTFPS